MFLLFAPRPQKGNGSLGVPFPLANGKKACPIEVMMKSNWRKPWDMLPNDYPEKFNYHITINPDPKCDWIVDNNCTDKKTHHKQLREFLKESFNLKLFSDVCIIYEYGRYGKKYGKLHYHCLFRTNTSAKLQIKAFEYFRHRSTKNTRAVVSKRITHSLKRSETHNMLLMKSSQLANKHYIYNQYFRKETHNKIKCLVHWSKINFSN